MFSHRHSNLLKSSPFLNKFRAGTYCRKPASTKNELQRAHLRLFIDFDSTITKEDTCTRIPKLLEEPIDGSSLKEVNQSRMNQISEWNRVSNQFMERYYALMTHFKESKQGFESVSQFLDAMDDVEMFGVRSVEEGRILRNLTRIELRNLIRKFNAELAPNCHNFFKMLSNKTDQNLAIQLCILSSNWSFDVIESFLKERVGPIVNNSLNIIKLDRLGHEEVNQEAVRNEKWSLETSHFPNVYIYSNDLRFGTDGTFSDGTFASKQCVTSMDKLLALRHHLFLTRDTSRSLYIGDSINDLRCIMETSGVLLVNDESPTRQVCEKFGIKMHNLQERTMLDYGHNLIHVAQDWSDITKTVENLL